LAFDRQDGSDNELRESFLQALDKIGEMEGLLNEQRKTATSSTG
jgi:hypothetical protein